MPGKFIAPEVARDLLAKRRQRETVASEAFDAEAQWRWVKQFNYELRAIDPLLQLVWCPDPAPVEAVAAGAKPGRFNVLRHNEGAPLSVYPIEGPDGEFVEPGSGVFEMLRRADLWSAENQRERERRLKELAYRRERREETEREERNQDAFERWLAVSRTQISMDTSVPWSQNAAGRGRNGKG